MKWRVRVRFTTPGEPASPTWGPTEAWVAFARFARLGRVTRWEKRTL